MLRAQKLFPQLCDVGLTGWLGELAVIDGWPRVRTAADLPAVKRFDSLRSREVSH
jgi:hypothetical protein